MKAIVFLILIMLAGCSEQENKYRNKTNCMIAIFEKIATTWGNRIDNMDKVVMAVEKACSYDEKEQPDAPKIKN